MTNKKIVMRTMFVVMLLIIVIILLAELNWFNKKQTYKPFRLEPNESAGSGFCEHYYQECVCYGGLTVMESYPMQYRCDGRESCKKISEVICRG